MKRATDGFRALLEALDGGQMELFDLPPEMRTRLANLQAEATDAVDDDF